MGISVLHWLWDTHTYNFLFLYGGEIMKQREGHFYLTVRKPLKGEVTLDCGETTKEVFDRLEVLDKQSNAKNPILVKKLIIVHEGEAIDCIFVNDELTGSMRIMPTDDNKIELK
jgi:hypothetical protein